MNVKISEKKLRNIAVVGGHLPRECGIATFTTHINAALRGAFPEANLFVVAVNDKKEGYEYPGQVRLEINQHDPKGYLTAAEFLNINNTDLVCLQHEYGIFGGEYGSFILSMLRKLRTPVVTTLHTILREPDPAQLRVMSEIAELSDRLIVMSRKGAHFLESIYNVSNKKIDIIPHGIPEMSFADPNYFKDQFGVEGKLVLLTFGLLSPNKGIEYVIEALPEIVRHHPNVVYIVLGATHPHVRQKEGEAYRIRLKRLAKSLGVEDNVIFYNRFVSDEELIKFISTADIYITPYLNKEQITSGTLSYACGAGKAVISTPYWHSEELLKDGKGILVPFRETKSITEEVLELLNNEARRHSIRKKAYLGSREMIWPEVARMYMNSFEKAQKARVLQPRSLSAVPAAITSGNRSRGLPVLKLDHLKRMTDDTGLLQHFKFSVPDYNHGYTTDDNARALYLMVLLNKLEWGVESGKEKQIHELSVRYLAFLHYAFNEENGRFRNFMNFNRSWMEETGSDDSHGRAIWSLGAVLGSSGQSMLKEHACVLFEKTLPHMTGIKSIRGVAFELFGINEYLKAFPGDYTVKTTRKKLAGWLMDEYRKHSTPDWPWFEPVLSYSNAKLAQALIETGHAIADKRMLKAGLESLKWLVELQKDPSGHFVPVGCNGFYHKNEERARFDQQPIEAGCTTSACLKAYYITGEKSWMEEARRAFEWFLGRNDLGLPLYDSRTGGCRDGLRPDRVNENQGAESTLAFLTALAEMQLAGQKIDGGAGASAYPFKPKKNNQNRVETVLKY